MSFKNDEVYNLPNLVSLIRICMSPVLLYLALTQQPNWYIGMLIFTVFTDVLDGFLARMLDQITEMGSRLDSWGDFVIYNTMAICAWILWPEILQQELLYFILILISFLVPPFIGFVKFRSVTSYHTWAVKLAVAVTIISYILLFSGLLDWPFRVAAALSLYAGIEEICITLLLRRPRVDVRTAWRALQYRRGN